MAWSKLTDSQWESIKDFFPPTARVGRPPTCRRKSIDGILWVLLNDAPWRNLPKEFGAWRTIYGLCQAWIATGVLTQVIRQLEIVIPPGKGELVAQGNADAQASREGAIENEVPQYDVPQYEEAQNEVSQNQELSQRETSYSDARSADEDDSDVRSRPAIEEGALDESRSRFN